VQDVFGPDSLLLHLLFGVFLQGFLLPLFLDALEVSCTIQADDLDIPNLYLNSNLTSKIVLQAATQQSTRRVAAHSV
jgi:hypothetical protein